MQVEMQHVHKMHPRVVNATPPLLALIHYVILNWSFHLPLVRIRRCNADSDDSSVKVIRYATKG